MGNPEPLIHWPDPILEWVGFVASFLAVGAVGFRLRVIARATHAPGTTTADHAVLHDATHRAAVLGLIGALVSAALFVNRLPEMAERQHVMVGQLLTTTGRPQLQAVLVLATAIGIVLAGSGAISRRNDAEPWSPIS